jgi:fructose-bisphosphate aldolase, class II
MPLVSIIETLRKASSGRFAVPLFDAFEMNAVEGIIAAAEEKKAPVIIAIYDALLLLPTVSSYTAFIRDIAERSPVPVSLMLDHGSSPERCDRALSLGFTDVMYDGSKLPIEENIASTRSVVIAARKTGAGVEAELGHVGEGSNYEAFGAAREGFTDPATVSRFVADTGCDVLAVAVGTAHGRYKGTPHIDLDLLAHIRRETDAPLALHGGTGLSERQYRDAIDAGIAKINIATDLLGVATEKMIEAARQPEASYLGMVAATKQAHRERCSYYFDLFGASGKG